MKGLGAASITQIQSILQSANSNLRIYQAASNATAGGIVCGTNTVPPPALAALQAALQGCQQLVPMFAGFGGSIAASAGQLNGVVTAAQIIPQTDPGTFDICISPLFANAVQSAVGIANSAYNSATSFTPPPPAPVPPAPSPPAPTPAPIPTPAPAPAPLPLPPGGLHPPFPPFPVFPPTLPPTAPGIPSPPVGIPSPLPVPVPLAPSPAPVRTPVAPASPTGMSATTIGLIVAGVALAAGGGYLIYRRSKRPTRTARRRQ